MQSFMISRGVTKSNSGLQTSLNSSSSTDCAQGALWIGTCVCVCVGDIFYVQNFTKASDERGMQVVVLYMTR